MQSKKTKQKNKKIKNKTGNSPVVQWVAHGALTAKGAGLIPGWETKILQASQYDQIKKQNKTQEIQRTDWWRPREKGAESGQNE